jgi:hypothetical protein
MNQEKIAQALTIAAQLLGKARFEVDGDGSFNLVQGIQLIRETQKEVVESLQAAEAPADSEG